MMKTARAQHARQSQANDFTAQRSAGKTSFAEGVVTQNKNVDKPNIKMHSPINTVDEYQEEGNAQVTYDPKAKKGERLHVGEFDESDSKVAR